MDRDLIVLGWREWLALPQLRIDAIKAKVDSGARSSALHVAALEEYRYEGRQWLRFVVLSGRGNATPVSCDAPAVDRREVSDSGGHVTSRWFIRSEFALGGKHWDAEINLTSRGNMLFPLLLGRNALAGRFIVDPGASYRHGRPRATRQRRTPR